MTNDEIDRMEGRALDLAVAENVMGIIFYTESWVDGQRGPYKLKVPLTEIAPYSTDIVAAWRVVEKLRAEGWFFQLGDVWPAAWQSGARSEWHIARFSNGSNAIASMGLGDALAICRAALKAVAAESHEPPLSAHKRAVIAKACDKLDDLENMEIQND